ncbi:MAG: epoxyqueuosine reductase QueH [Clostridia bacterium]|nr:epoxyqueuosine reductase QueH [Clostridia bacterium]
MTEKIIAEIKATLKKPKLLLHVCCAPCSSYVLEYLSEFFEITLYFYNPNISPEKEYLYRYEELKRLLVETKSEAKLELGEYEPESFLEIARGREDEPEGGERCFLCYKLRLSKSGEYAARHGFDYFTTSLSISPYKNAEKLNEIGKEIAEELKIKYLYSDFKKKNGYKRSIELSKQYGLYRQDYCGCAYSKAQKEKTK